MKYLKTIIFACIILQTTFIFSQFEDVECDFVPDAGMYETSKYSATVKSNFSEDEHLIFNVYYHIINPSNGINPYGVTEDHILATIAQLNINFNQYNIYYKYSGFRTINDDAVYNADESQFQYLLNLDEDYGNYINVMITPPISVGGAANRNKQYVKIPAWNFTNIDVGSTVITHEFGHLAGLFHTFTRTYNNDVTIDNNICPPVFNETESYANLRTPRFLPPDVSEAENVTRDITSPFYNANHGGDRVTDTPATFFGADYNYCLDLNTDILTYITHPDIVDDTGTNEPYVNVDLRNFMAYGPLGKEHFTNGQGVRMREEILSPSNTQYTPRLALLDDGTPDLSILYTPYKNEYFGVGPNLPNHRTLFQPGFDYTFTQCGGTQQNYGMQIYNSPSNYDDTSFIFSTNTHSFGYKIDKYSLDLNNITHANHTAIFIQQLNEFSLEDGGQPRKCYNNFNRNANSGTVIKYEDDYPNTNVTIQNKNATEINDENLIQNLENGLYIIKKNFDDGTQEQKTILKNDN